MCGREPWKKWTAMYWFAYKAYSAVIRWWIWQCMKRLENWLENNSLHVSPIFPYVSSCFTYCFPSFFGCFPCLPWCFSLFPILGLTNSKFQLFAEKKPSNFSLRIIFCCLFSLPNIENIGVFPYPLKYLQQTVQSGNISISSKTRFSEILKGLSCKSKLGCSDQPRPQRIFSL